MEILVTSDYVEDHYEQTTPALVTNENTDYTHTEDVPVQYSYSSEDSKQMINEYDDFENKKTSAELDKEPLPTPPSYYDESTDDTKSIVIPVILSKDSTETVTDVSETPIDSITERYHSTDFSMEVLSDDADSTDESIHLTEQFNYVHGLDIEHDIEEGAQTDIFADQSTASMSTSEPDWYREFNEYIENNPPFFEKISSQLGKRIILRCPLLSMVPAESFDEIYWLHHNKKVPMDFNSVNKLGMSTMIADNESVGEWKCFIRFDKNSFLISYSDVSLDETTGEYVEGTEYEDFTIPYTIPVSVTNLPTEKELTEWITSTESDAFALFAYPPSASVRLGDSVAVSCVSENVPHGVAIYFIKTDPYGLATGQVKKAYQNGYANYTLIIHNVNSETAGHYQCIAMTNDRRAVKADFQINIEQPDIYLKHETASPPSTTAIEKIDEILPSTALSIRDSLFTIGFPAFVRCSGVKPDDYGRIIWYFNNKEITHRNDEYLNFGDTLFIRRMTTDTAGLYGCSVDHSITSYGRADGKVLFQHEGSPYEDEFNQFERVRVDRRAISHKYGDPLIIRCSSTEPSDYFRWYKIKDGHTTVASEESILYIQSFTEIGDTIFKCQVRSAFGEVAETSSYVRTEGEPIVTRHEPVHEPLKVWIEPHNVKPKLGDKILLDCRSNKPISYVHWRKLSDDDGSPGDALSYHQKLYLFMEEVSDYGSYKCSIDSADQDHSSVVTTLTMDNVVAPENVDDDNDEIELKRCANDEATCRDGSCIKRSKICDGIPDCPDATDEKGCGAAGQTEGECHPDQFLCASTKQCIQKIWLCDGENDCDDGNDELPAQCEHMAYSMSSKCKQSEFQCQHTNYTQCIPKSYICDESVDCLDQSDEVGCVKPTVIVPPEVEKQIKVGDTLTLRCLARGNPLPFINWRLNWGFVCGDGYDNGRCIMKQELDERNPDVVIGTLTVRNMQKGDAGAYSCEAINSKGFHFAIPDAFVVVKSSAAPSQCNEFGTMDKFNGVCRCKLNVISPTCSQCKHGYYDLSEKNDHGCRSCFCSGVSKDCDSDTSRFKSISVDLLNPEQPWQVIHENYPIHPWVSTQIIPDYSQASILVEHLNAGVPGNLYWQPSQMNIFPHGNLIKSYGGNMIIRLKKDGLEDLSLIDGPLVWLRGNKIDLVHHYKESYNIQDGIITVNLRIDENSFKRLDGTTPDRAHVMMALANVDKFWIWAGDSTRHNLPCKILSISIDIANPAGNGLLASSVERCKCPLGYTGTSCEQCANGYTRHDGVGLYLGECHSCFDHCNGKTDKCNRDSGQCYDCKDNTSGNRCQLCAQGFRRQHGTDKCERISEIQDKPAPIITINDELYDIARKFVVTIKPGERRVLKLHSEDVVPSPSSLWLRVESNGERVRLPNGIKQVGHNLIIENAAAQMLGTYEIKLQMTDGQFILVQVILQFDEEAHSRFQPFLEPQGIIRKLINEGVTINLNLNGFPVNRVIWTKDNQQIPSQVIQDYYQLVINRLSPELCGTYEATLMPMIAIEPKILKTTIECVSEERPYSVIQESVFNTPKISFSPPEVYLYEGQIMLVSYEILGEQPVELQWNRVVNGELYPMPSSFTILPDHVILNSSRPEDAGTYKVKASNRYGMDEATLIIHIRKFQETRYEDSGEPEVRFDSTVYELYPGQSIRIEPIIRSHTAYVTKWTDRNSNPLPIGIRKDGDALVIDSMSAQLTGSYVLEVLSANAKVRVPVDIEIKDEEVHQTQQVVERYAGQAANIEASLPPKVSVEIGGTFEIRCTVAGVDSDAVQYTWIKHSHEPSSDLPPHIQAIGSTLRGQNIQPSDYAYYMCKAEVPLTGETVVAYTLLDVQRRKIAPSALIFPSDLIDVYEGESVSFTCYPQEGDPHPDISWSRIDGKAILPPSRIIDSQLELIQVSKETATQYQCTMTNIAGSSSAIATVNIKAPPGIKIMTNPDHIGDIHNEHPVYVQCVASGTPTPDVYWTRNGHNVTMPEPGYSLLIINPSLLSNGIHSFECVAKNIYEIKRYSTSIRIYHERQLSAENDVIKSKSITASITAEPKSPKVGDDILLTCSIDRDTQWNRPVTYIWRKDGKHLSTNLNLERFDIHLIRKASHMDSGVYECDIEGNQFTYKAHFSLQISDLLSSTQRTSNKLSTVGSDVSLECPLASAHPTIEIEWSRYESVLPSQSHIFEDKLIIQDIQQEDSGIYICTIKQNRQIQQHFVNLTVNYAGLIGVQNYPISVQLSATPTEFSYGYKVTMFCYVAHNNINVRYSWLKDGRSRMRSGVALKDNRIELYVQQADLGIYTCDVTRQNDGGLIGSSSLEMYADPIRLGLVHIRSAQKPLKTVEKLQPIAKGDRPVLIKIRPLQGNYHINGQIGFECDSSARDADIFWERVSPTLLISLPARIEQNRIMFDRFSHDDVGQYVCNVKSDGKIHKKYLHLDIDLSNQDVLFSYPEHELVLSYGAPNINVTFLNPPSEFKRGGNIEVECIVSGQQDAPITWTREKKDMSSNTFIHKTILKFFNFVEHNLGEYRCSAKTSVGELSKIIVFEPESFPGISFNTSSYKSKIDFQFLSSRSDFRAGGHVVVECVVSDSLAHITWKKLRKSNSASMKVKDRFLIISPFTSSDLGTYECQAITNGEVIMRSLEFDEHNLYANLLPVNEDVLPNIELKMSEKNTYTVGGKIDITCTVKNDPTALISWHRGNRRHLGSATEIRDNLLRFHNVMSEDVGIYSCIATNNHGSQYISFEIKISDDNSVHILNEQETKIPITRTKTPLITEFLNPLSEFKRNGEISVLCYFANDVPGTVEWAKISDDQKRILPLQNTAEINGAKLRFLSFNAADLGLYQCTGYGEHGVSKRVVKLDDHTFSVIKRIPKIYSESESDKLQIIVEGQEIGQRVKLLCKMNTSRIAVKWEYEGGQIVDEFNTIMQIGTRLIFEKFQPKHHGVYTCKARYNGTRMIKHVDTRMHIHDNKDNILSSWLIF
ncbi:hypothetical protein GJ496_004291 [Pomphorhynchus laevis]|nr:hypothetical protein GJ496_004291 [Pomphorhynchus laevis]